MTTVQITPKQLRFYNALYMLPDHSGTVSDMIKAGVVYRGEGLAVAQTFRHMEDLIKSEDSDQLNTRGIPKKKWTCIGGDLSGTSPNVRTKTVHQYPVMHLVAGDKGPDIYDDGTYAPESQWERIYGEPHSPKDCFPELVGTHVEIPVESHWIGVGPQDGPEGGGFICVPINATLPLYKEDKQKV